MLYLYISFHLSQIITQENYLRELSFLIPSKYFICLIFHLFFTVSEGYQYIFYIPFNEVILLSFIYQLFDFVMLETFDAMNRSIVEIYFSNSLICYDLISFSVGCIPVWMSYGA